MFNLRKVYKLVCIQKSHQVRGTNRLFPSHYGSSEGSENVLRKKSEEAEHLYSLHSIVEYLNFQCILFYVKVTVEQMDITEMY